LRNGSRPNQTPESWGRARLASFILKRGAYIKDKDIWKLYHIDSKIKPRTICKNRNKSKTKQSYKRDKMTQMCFRPYKNTLSEHPAIKHCFVDGTHQTCCILGPKARKYADDTGNPIGKLSKDIDKYYRKKKNKLTPWCTCTGSEVCRFYADKFNDGTHIKFINDNRNNYYYNQLQKNSCEQNIKKKIGYKQHHTPGIHQKHQHKCIPNMDYKKNITK
jgi:hypothetical protein